MERIRKTYVNIIDSKIYKNITAFLFPVLIIIYAYIKVNKGGDITDTTYSYGNFVNINKLDGMWYYSTFYANLLGNLFTGFPFGHRMLFLNIYTGIFKALAGLISYFFFAYTKEIKLDRNLSFLGALVAVGLAWCPTATLYNYLTYFFFLVAAVLLYLGLVRNKNSFIFLAGFALGCNFFVRLPNVVECALILPLWIYLAIKKENIKKIINKTLISILGFFAAFIPGAILIALTRGFGEYFKGISELFSMTSEATGYAPQGMLLIIYRAYISAGKYFVPFLAIIVIALITDFLSYKKILKIKKIFIYSLAAPGMLAAFAFEYKKGVFNRNYHTFESVYNLGAVFTIILVITLLLVLVSIKKTTAEEKLLCLISGVIWIITPIGSNNGIYSILNNMFFLIPAFLLILTRLGSWYQLGTTRFVIVIYSAIFFFQSILFGAIYIFRDGADGKMNVAVDNDVFIGMRTTSIHAERLDSVTKIWEKYELYNKPVLLYGDCPGLAFYLESPQAISSSWPSLASFADEKFEHEMAELDDSIGDEGTPPPVIIGENAGDGLKKEILNEFLDKYDYMEVYANNMFKVYLPEEQINE